MILGTGKTYDLKVGYSCNNNCVHCVIRPNVNDLKKMNLPIDSSYGELVKVMQSPEFVEADGIVLTGGEPTIRKDFMRIVKYIVRNYPQKYIHLQTNARLLTQYLDELKNLTDRIRYVIALHSMDEEVHNRVVGNENDGTNPFKETMECLMKIKEIYHNFKDIARIEIVLSQYNYRTMVETVEKLYEIGINNIGISYPHFDGYYMDNGPTFLKKVSLSYEELKPHLYEVYKLCEKHSDLYTCFEEVPQCMWRDNNGKLLKPLPNIGSLSDRKDDQISVKFPGGDVNTDFKNTWLNMHKQSSKCQECVYCCSCLGVWFEAIETFGDLGFESIKEHELEELKGGLHCF